EVFHKLLDRRLVDVRHPQELADCVGERAANCFQDYSLIVLTRFLTFPRTAAIISGKQIVASPYTSTNLPPFRIFLQLIDSASGAPLNPPGSGLSAVICTARSMPSRKTLDKRALCFGNPPPSIRIHSFLEVIDISTLLVTSSNKYGWRV